MGNKVNGEPIYEVRHINDVKIVVPDSLLEPVARPKKGRPKSRPQDVLEEIASIDFSKPPPNVIPWSASKADIAQLNLAIQGH